MNGSLFFLNPTNHLIKKPFYKLALLIATEASNKWND